MCSGAKQRRRREREARERQRIADIEAQRRQAELDRQARERQAIKDRQDRERRELEAQAAAQEAANAKILADSQAEYEAEREVLAEKQRNNLAAGQAVGASLKILAGQQGAQGKTARITRRGRRAGGPRATTASLRVGNTGRGSGSGNNLSI